MTGLIEELLLRDQLERSHKLGRGEAACIVLAEREHAPALFVSEDDEACKVARIRGVNVVMRQSVLEHWVKQTKPSRTDLDMLLRGLEKARFTVHPQEIKALYKLL